MVFTRDNVEHSTVKYDLYFSLDEIRMMAGELCLLYLLAQKRKNEREKEGERERTTLLPLKEEIASRKNDHDQRKHCVVTTPVSPP